MADDIIKYFPNNYDSYVEPFFGGGGVFWKTEKTKKEVVNDLDKSLIQDYRLVKKIKPNGKFRKDLDTLESLTRFIQSKPTSNEDKLTQAVIRRCNGFGGRYAKTKIYKDSNPFNKLKNIDAYQQRLKGVKIENIDWKTIIKKYDSKSALFYLDPPYENSDTLYEHSIIDYQEMVAVLSSIKGKFVLSINGSRNIKKTFSKFRIVKLKLKTNARKHSDIGGKNREELLIMNY
jgi:DNA adenine methylase